MNAFFLKSDDRLTGAVLAALAVLLPLTAVARNALSPSAALETPATVAEIRSSHASTRDKLARDIERRLQAGDRALDETARQAAATLPPNLLAEFRAAVKRVHLREQAMRDGLANARIVDARAWPDTRARLADRYEALAAAVSSAEGFSGRPRLAPAAGEPAGD